MYNHLLYLLYWAVNSIVIFAVSQGFSANIVLGNHRFSAIESAIYAGFWLTFFVWAMWDYVRSRGVNLDSTWGALSYFWVINTIGIWLIARFPHIVGLGISSYLVAIFLGLAVNVAQRITWEVFIGTKT